MVCERCGRDRPTRLVQLDGRGGEVCESCRPLAFAALERAAGRGGASTAPIWALPFVLGERAAGEPASRRRSAIGLASVATGSTAPPPPPLAVRDGSTIKRASVERWRARGRR